MSERASGVAPGRADRALLHRDRIVVSSLAIEFARQVGVALGHV